MGKDVLRMKRRWTWGLLPLLAAAPGVAVGCAVMRVQGVGASAILQNVAALLAGGMGAWLYAAHAVRRMRAD